MAKKLGILATISLSFIGLLGLVQTRTQVVYASDSSSEPTTNEVAKNEDTNKTIEEYTNTFVTPMIMAISSLDLVAIGAFLVNLIVTKSREKKTNNKIEEVLNKSNLIATNTINSIQEVADQIKELMPAIVESTQVCTKVSHQFQNIVKDFSKQIKDNTVTTKYLNELYAVLISIEKDIVTHTKELVANGTAEKVCGIINTLKGLKNENKN